MNTSIFVAFLIVEFVCSALAQGDAGPVSRNDMIEQCRQRYESENRNCRTIQATYNGGCTFECTCDGGHRRTLQFKNFTECDWRKVCFKSECREVVDGDYDPRRYIALRDLKNPCLVELIDRRLERPVRNINQEGKRCTNPATGARGTCRNNRCVEDNGGTGTGPPNNRDMLAQCKRRYDSENIRCGKIDAKRNGKCTFQCTCDGGHRRTLQFRNFTECDWRKVCFNSQCREVVDGDYDPRRYIALRDVRNPCLVDLIDRRLQWPVGNLPQDGEPCVNPDTQLPGTCQGINCIEDWGYGYESDDGDTDDGYCTKHET